MVKEERQRLESEARFLEGAEARVALRKAAGRTVAEVMTRIPVCINPDASVAAAAHMMRDQNARRLPVVTSDSRVIGVVSRSDLLKVFLRTDQQLAREVRAFLSYSLERDPSPLRVAVAGGVVSVEGELERRSQARYLEQRIPLLEGVVAVDSRLTYRRDDTPVG